jgi:hypothetical protein
MGDGKLPGFSIFHLRCAIQDAFFSILLASTDAARKVLDHASPISGTRGNRTSNARLAAGAR